MDFQLREKEIFDILKKINDEFVLIGGYAVNAYTLPRFSRDCDIVVKDVKKIEKQLIGYSKVDEVLYGGFVRYEKIIKKDFSASIDILTDVLDRQTNTVFPAAWIFNNSKKRLLRGKTIMERLRLRIINLDALFVMKMISARAPDIRDVFMLALGIDSRWVKNEISKKYDFDKSFNKVKDKIESQQFRDGLQGVFGKIDDRMFEKHKKAVLRLNK